MTHLNAKEVNKVSTKHKKTFKMLMKNKISLLYNFKTKCIKFKEKNFVTLTTK